MKYAVASAALLGLASAFPADFANNVVRDASAGEQQDMPAGMRKMLAERSGKRQDKGVNVPFDAKSQYVSTSGDYVWVAPGPTDIRGPCPGLNAIANHGYLPHNGVATIQQFIDGTNGVYGMGFDLAGFLAVYGAVFDGNLVSWSIGGPPPAGVLDLGGILGQPEGLSGSHNKYEADVSPTRGDLYQHGNDYTVVESQWDELFNQQAGETEESSNYDLGVLTSFRGKRFNQSLYENPYFFNAPFAGVIVQPAAYTFIYRFFANKSEESPEGRLSKNVLKSFFGVEGEPGAWKIQHGYERIPDNWYKRNFADQYSIPFFALDVIAAGETYPEFVNIGGNLGKTNSFVGLDVSDLSGGVYRSSSLLEGNNLMCFGFELIAQAAPDLIENLFVDTSLATGKMATALQQATSTLGGCPQINQNQQGEFSKLFMQYPGVTDLKADGSYKATSAPQKNMLLSIL